jgi:cell division control protein 24
MATVASRKKSISTTLQIDTPVAHNTLLNKAASQSTSLYQQCSSLRNQLMRIRDFAPYFALASSDSRRSTDPVTQLWDLFSLGIPLCFIFNLLDSVNKITTVDTNPEEFDVTNERAKKRAILLFAMQIKQFEECEPFTVTDLWDRNSTDGLVKASKIT